VLQNENYFIGPSHASCLNHI